MMDIVNIKRKADNLKREAVRDFMGGFGPASEQQGGQRIERPFSRPRSSLNPVVLSLSLALVVLVGLSGYFVLQNRKLEQSKSALVATGNTVVIDWYALKLSDGELIYGQVQNLEADPLTINPVYYNYDQKKDTASDKTPAINEAGDIRLVRRGLETHGPDGSLTVFRSGVVYMEKLRSDSKVLKVILDNEKQ